MGSCSHCSGAILPRRIRPACQCELNAPIADLSPRVFSFIVDCSGSRSDPMHIVIRRGRHGVAPPLSPPCTMFLTRTTRENHLPILLSAALAVKVPLNRHRDGELQSNRHDQISAAFPSRE